MRSIPAQIKSYAPGFALALVIALLAKGIEALLPFDVIGASVIAMFIGMLINGYRKPGKTTAPGVKFTAKKILKFAIILLGASLNVTTILNVGRMSLAARWGWTGSSRTSSPRAPASVAAAPSRRSHPSSTPRTATSPTPSPRPSSLIWR